MAIDWSDEIDWNFEVVDQLESHWQQQLRPRLDGLTDDEYFWQPVPGCWTISRRGESSAPLSVGAGDFTIDSAEEPVSPEPVTTIAWRLGHLLAIFGPPGTPHFDRLASPPQELRFPGTAAEALRQLDEGHDAWLADVRLLGADGLTRPQGALSPPQFADAPMARLIMYTHLEVIHHGAEICLLRDLYRAKFQ
jgi:hypothetical protein